jgi:hypothetical protein
VALAARVRLLLLILALLLVAARVVQVEPGGMQVLMPRVLLHPTAVLGVYMVAVAVLVLQTNAALAVQVA